MLKRTALYAEHARLGGRLIDFGGWELPVQYTGVMEEHLACRHAGGIFDVSHMGEFLVEGADAEAYLNHLVTNDVSKIAVNQAQYTVMANERGGLVDDLVIYRRARDRFLAVVNASNTAKDFAHFESVRETVRGRLPGVTLTEASARYTQIALQGRIAAPVLQKLTKTDLAGIKNYWFTEGELGLSGAAKIPAVIARTGYTGEDGFELYVPWDSGPELWRMLLELGTPLGLKPCGLGARDTLRLEMRYPLYGNELSDETDPLEAGLGWVVKLDKGVAFVGQGPISETKRSGLKRKLVGLKLRERGIPRHGYGVFSGDTRVGEVTSGTQSPSLREAIGVAYVATGHSAPGTRLAVEIRGVKIPAEVVPTPFYKRDY